MKNIQQIGEKQPAQLLKQIIFNIKTESCYSVFCICNFLLDLNYLLLNIFWKKVSINHTSDIPGMKYDS